jgi:hypothetical protein
VQENSCISETDVNEEKLKGCSKTEITGGIFR